MTNHLPPQPDEIAENVLGAHVMERAILQLMRNMIECQNGHVVDAYMHLSNGRIAEARQTLREGIDHFKTSAKALCESCAERDRLHDAAVTLLNADEVDRAADADPVAAQVAADFLKKVQ